MNNKEFNNNSCLSHVIDKKLVVKLDRENCENIFRFTYAWLEKASGNLVNILDNSLYQLDMGSHHVRKVRGICKDDININSIVDEAKEVLGCTTNEAICKLKEFIGIHKHSIRANNCNNIEVPTSRVMSFYKSIRYTKDITYYQPKPLNTPPKDFILDEDVYKYIGFVGADYISPRVDDSGIVLYQNMKTDQSITILYNIVEFTESARGTQDYKTSLILFGHNNSKILPVGYENIKRSDCIVIFCQDPVLAYHLQVRLHESQITRGKFVVTTSYGSSDYVDRINFSCFEDKDIIFIPAPTEKEISNIEKYHEYFEAVDVNSIKILPYPVAPFCSENMDSAEGSKLEAYIANEKVILDSFEEISKFVEKVQSDAVDADYAVKFYKRLIAKDTEEVEVKDSLGIKLNELRDKPFIPNEQILDNFIAPKYRTLLVAPSDSGKSHFARLTTYNFATGQSFLGFEGGTPSKILYIDAENSYEDIKYHYESIIANNGAKIHHEKGLSNITIIASGDVSDLDLTTPAGAEAFVSRVVKGGFKVVVVDNFITAVQVDNKNEASLNFFLKNIVQRLREHGIATVLVHHTGHNESRALGTSKFDGLFQNVIMVYKPEKIEEFKDKLPSEIYEKYSKLAAQGIRFSIIKFDKIKGFDKLRGAVSIIYFNEETGQYENYIPYAEAATTDSVNEALPVNESPKAEYEEGLRLLIEKVQALISDKFKELASKILTALFHMQKFSKKATFYSKDDICLRAEISKEDSTVRDCFQELQKHEIINREGATSNKKHVISDCYMDLSQKLTLEQEELCE